MQCPDETVYPLTDITRPILCKIKIVIIELMMEQCISQVLSKYDEKLGEITKIKEAAMEKELLLKDSETKVLQL